MTGTTTTDRNATDEVRRIGELQREAAALLDELGDRVEALNIEIARRTESLRRAVEATRSRALAAEIAEALAGHAVDTGDLSSRFCDALEAKGRKVHPTAYATTKARWGLVRNA